MPEDRRPELVLRRFGSAARLISGESLPRVASADLGTLRVVRPADLVDLTFSFHNLTTFPTKSRSKPPRLVRGPSRGPGYLTVRFAPQHLAEETFYEDSAGHITTPALYGPPVRALLSGQTQLVFKVLNEEIPFTLTGLLSACTTLELFVPDNAVPARDGRPLLLNPLAVLRDQPRIRLRSAERTARTYEAVYRLRSMVGNLAYRFGPEAAIMAARHVEAARSVGAVERLVGDLERTRERAQRVIDLQPGLVPADPFAGGRTAIELPFRLLMAPHRDLRFWHAGAPVDHGGRVELWHSRLGEAGEREQVVAPASRTVRAVWTRDSEFSDPSSQPAWRLPLTADDRNQIVNQTSNFTLKYHRRPWEPSPVHVNRLMLSSLGGWLDSRGHWDTQPTGYSLQEWRQRTAMGRDFYVKVVIAGFLFPFGHRASYIRITERRLEEATGEPVAYLVQKSFVMVRELQKSYGNTGHQLADGRLVDPMMPLRTIEFLTRITPAIDEPKTPYLGSRPEQMFFPIVDGSRFPFKVVATDIEGNVVEFGVPLLFVDKRLNDIGATFADQIAQKYNQDTDVAGLLNGQRVVFAPHHQPDDTSLDVASMRFDGVALRMPSDDPQFTPMLRDSEAVVPAIRHLSGNAAPVRVSYMDSYAKFGFSNTLGENAGEVFLKVDDADLDFARQSDRSGGLVSPSVKVSGLSRKTGPVGGNPATVATGDFTPADFFKGLDGAKLFGVVRLVDLIAPLTGAFNGDITKIPRFVSQSVSVIAALTTDLIALEAISGLGAEGTAVKNDAAAMVTALDPAKLVAGLPDTATLADDITALLAAQAGALAGAARHDVAATLARVHAIVTDTGFAAALVAFGSGAAVPEVVHGHLDWQPDLLDLKIITPSARGKKGQMTVAVDLRAAPGSKTPVADVTCRIENITLNLLPHPDDFIALPVEHITFEARAGKKPEVDVKLGGLEFLGVLQFVKKLQQFIPSDGFSDPPYLDVDPTGLSAGYSLALPTIAVGVFSLENVNLGADLRVPFIGEALEFSFRFCTREKPFHLIVSLFGGGGFFGITITPSGLKVLEAALEFGAEISIDFGVASGGVSIMAGIYFRMEVAGGVTNAALTGYLCIRGEVDVLGLISACIELYMSFSYEFSSEKCVGRATIHVEVQVLFFSASVAISCEKKFAGSAGDPSFADLMAPRAGDRPWEDYCRAFAEA